MKKICVIGSLNIDLVINVERFHIPGETISGLGKEEHYGGKGANQAIALGKLGADVAMFGVVGNDSEGSRYKKHLSDNNVETKYLSVYDNEVTGSAIIEVDSDGENRIIIIPGANAKLDNDYFDSIKMALLNYDIFLFQLETPLNTVEKFIKFLSVHDKTIILDPAPAQELNEDILKHIDYITPNNSELQLISNLEIKGISDVIAASKVLLRKGVQNVIAKSGSNGAYLINADGFKHFKGFKVDAIDTIAAGDAFNAGFAYSIAKNHEIDKAIITANAVGALTTLGKGAQGSMPTIKDVNKILTF